MLSDAAKAEIIGALAGCFVVSVALLVCLICPCPLRAAVTTCIDRDRSGQKKPLRNTGGQASNCCRCCCFSDCCLNQDAVRHKSATDYGLCADQQGAAVVHLDPPRRPKASETLMPRVTLTFAVTRLPDCLAVHLHSADGTPGPRLGLCHCNFALVQTIDVASAAASDTTNAEDSVRTGVVGRTATPVFNETLVLPLSESVDAASMQLLVRCLDYDRFSRERIVGEVRVPLPEAIDLTVQYSCLPMEPPQIESGELLVALHYMPTAEKLRVLLLKANGVYAQDGSAPATYLQLVLLASGSAVCRIRTRIYDQSPSPIFNESVSFDLPRWRLDHVSLIVSVMNCRLKQSVRPDLDMCLGYTVFSSSCYGSGRDHWLEMIDKPRTPLACWHRLT